MAIGTINGGNEAMKWEPFGLLAAYGAAGLASVKEGYPPEFIVALVSGGFLALCISLIKSRKRKADGIDTALWAMAGVVGSMVLAFLFAPSLDGKIIPVVGIKLEIWSAGFLIALAGTPLIEWLASPHPLQLLMRGADSLTDRFGGGKGDAA